MNILVRERLYGYALMGWLGVSRWRRLRDPAIRLELFRQIHAHGIAALPVTGGLALLMGAALVTQLTALVGQDNDMTQSWLFWGLFFELAPLLSGLVLVARSSATIATELAVMQLHGDVQALQDRGLSPADQLLLPRMAAAALALPVLTIFFQTISVISGWLAVSALQGLPLLEVAERFLDLASPWLTLLSLFKSALTGLVVAGIACLHGNVAHRSTHELSDTAIHAVGNGMVAVFLIDVVVALLLFLAR
jgi:phospholipid/cholesterol/gamma-HCH transport system permease protein